MKAELMKKLVENFRWSNMLLSLYDCMIPVKSTGIFGDCIVRMFDEDIIEKYGEKWEEYILGEVITIEVNLGMYSGMKERWVEVRMPIDNAIYHITNYPEYYRRKR